MRRKLGGDWIPKSAVWLMLIVCGCAGTPQEPGGRERFPVHGEVFTQFDFFFECDQFDESPTGLEGVCLVIKDGAEATLATDTLTNVRYEERESGCTMLGEYEVTLPERDFYEMAIEGIQTQPVPVSHSQLESSGGDWNVRVPLEEVQALQ